MWSLWLCILYILCIVFLECCERHTRLWGLQYLKEVLRATALSSESCAFGIGAGNCCPYLLVRAPNQPSYFPLVYCLLLILVFPLHFSSLIYRTEIFSGKTVTHEDICYEQACILYNLGELMPALSVIKITTVLLRGGYCSEPGLFPDSSHVSHVAGALHSMLGAMDNRVSEEVSRIREDTAFIHQFKYHVI